MRRSPNSLGRHIKRKTSIIAASLILALLAVIAIAARLCGSGTSLVYINESSGFVPASETIEANVGTQVARADRTQSSADAFPKSLHLRVTAQKQLQQSESDPAHKLQPNVLSTFTVKSIPAVAPSSPEQTAFVAAYQQLKPILSVTSYIPSNRPTRGILLPAGKSLRLGSAFVTLQILRETLQCDLPVEVWHIAGEIDAYTKAVFETNFTGVTCRDATTVPYPSHHKPAKMKGYALKAFALYATSFSEVLLLDADNLPVLNPALLFDSPEYRLHGNMFWPDLFAVPLSRVSGIRAEAYHILGWSEPWGNAAIGNSSFMFAESGQFLLDRRRHADIVEWAWFINSWGNEGIYKQLMNGDKDSFLLAFTLANKSSQYYQVPEYVRLCLHDVPEGTKLEHVGILHHNPKGQVAFFHRTSGGKANPLAEPGKLFQAHYTTVPLPAQVAWDLFDGAAETGNYRYPKGRFQTGVLGHCSILQGDQVAYRPSCASSVLQEQQNLPVSVLTQQDIIGSQVGLVYNTSHVKFVQLQEMMQTPGQRFLKELAWF